MILRIFKGKFDSVIFSCIQTVVATPPIICAVLCTHMFRNIGMEDTDHLKVIAVAHTQLWSMALVLTDSYSSLHLLAGF